MIELHETTLVAAPVQRTFDRARSIDVHLLAADGSWRTYLPG